MLCDSGNYIVEASVCSGGSCETGYSKMPSNETLEASSPRLIDPDLKPSLGHFTSTSSDYAINRAKASKHPNIQHHPTIHPHSRYQRTLLNTLNRSIISENNSQPSNLNNLDQYQERKETEEHIRRIQEAINELNNEIFKDQSNYRRPPSEYLDVYNELTQQLHYLQEKKQTLELRLNAKSDSADEECASNTPPSRDSSDTDEHSYRIPSLRMDNSPKSLQAKHSHTPTSPSSPLAHIFPLSPTSAQSDPFSLPQSNSSVSLPASATNPNLSGLQVASPFTQNSRSFVEITDTTQTGSSQQINGASNSSTPFLRIYIGSSTAVVEKKSVALRDVVSSKLKNRNMEIKKCIAYIKDTNLKLDWSIEVNKIKADSIGIAELSDEIRHSFEKKTLTLRSCDSCKKRTLLNVYACSKCLYVMCRRDECRTKSEQFVCAPRKINSFNSLVGSVNVLPKSDLEYYGRSESPVRDMAIKNISQQILPVNQLKVSIPSRDRSRSETELNIYVNPKLTIDNSRPVPKSPSSMCKLTTATNNIYNTMPRTQYIKSNSSNIDGISGSVNRESGSVLSSMYAKSLSCEPKVAVKVNRPKQNKPSRRDSFNSWEIPFKQINIDMNKKVGSGSFGIVHQGCDFYHGTVAVKFLNVQNPTPNQSNAFRNEVAILKSTRHDNILLFIGCILKPYLAIVTEWCPGSSLYRHLHVEEDQWDHTQLIDIAKQTSIGMEYLHARDILHRDLKSNNIFLIPKESNIRLNNFAANYDFLSEQESQRWTVKIGDFGLATVKSTWSQNTVRTNQPTGSILWMAPEVIKQKVTDPYTQKSDVYSYSVVLYELFSGQLPYQHKEQNMILFLVGSGRLRPDWRHCRSDTPPQIKELIEICSEYERDNRLDFVQINEKFQSIKFSKLKMGRLQRAKSVPNVSLSQLMSQMSGIYDDDLYPITPQLQLRHQINLPSIFNNINLNETSQLITNL